MLKVLIFCLNYKSERVRLEKKYQTTLQEKPEVIDVLRRLKKGEN